MSLWVVSDPLEETKAEQATTKGTDEAEDMENQEESSNLTGSESSQSPLLGHLWSVRDQAPS